ncbi:protein phosphatase 2C domain-containing protein [Bacillus sp. AK031]
MVVGHFGGNSSEGQTKNEDGCLVWTSEKEDWEFAILLDAHDTAESAELIVSSFYQKKAEITSLLQLGCESAFNQLNKLALTIFKSNTFKEACQKIQGETSCLIVVRKANFLSWLSVGDCILHLYHPELARLGEYQQNHRSFYEWVGKESTFNKSVPCYSTGIKELRRGKNHIFMTTDGLTECPGVDFQRPGHIFSIFDDVNNLDGVTNLLHSVKNNKVRDSTTILSWMVENENNATMPGNMREGK